MGAGATKTSSDVVSYNGDAIISNPVATTRGSANNNLVIMRLDASGNKVWSVVSTYGDAASGNGGIGAGSAGWFMISEISMESCFPVMLKIIFSSFPLYTFSIHGFRRLFLGEIVSVFSVMEIGKTSLENMS